LLRHQDEPLWTAMALLSVGSLEAALGNYDDAERHLAETRAVAERFDNDWLAGASRVRQGSWRCGAARRTMPHRYWKKLSSSA
jgi:hypothetical protein